MLYDVQSNPEISAEAAQKVLDQIRDELRGGRRPPADSLGLARELTALRKDQPCSLRARPPSSPSI
jgi:hypothetical protein